MLALLVSVLMIQRNRDVVLEIIFVFQWYMHFFSGRRPTDIPSRISLSTGLNYWINGMRVYTFKFKFSISATV